MVASKESKHLAAPLFAETIARHGVEPGLTVHADRGSATKSDTLATIVGDARGSAELQPPAGVDDNAFSEAQFKTLQYQPDYPGRFVGELHARGSLAPFFGWRNDAHHHSSLALFTPPTSSSVGSSRYASSARRRWTPRTSPIPSASRAGRSSCPVASQRGQYQPPHLQRRGCRSPQSRRIDTLDRADFQQV